MSQFQLVPYNRIEDYFLDQVGLKISTGSFFNFNKEAFELLSAFEIIAKNKLLNSPIIHADETGINVNGKRLWLHTACNDLWTHFFPHNKRGS
jgi:transposase